MIKLIGALVVFVLCLLIIGAKTVLCGAKRTWQKAMTMADEKIDHSIDDPEFSEMYRHLNLFLRAQEFLLTMGEARLSFANEREKLRYFHFVLGAIDQLSRRIKDERRAELWGMTTYMARAAVLFGAQDAVRHLESYGRSGDDELHKAGERGWMAMRTYILSAVGKASEEDFQKSCTELIAVVRGWEPKGI